VRPIPIVAGLVVVVLLWLVRPMWHGLAMFLWTAPLVWVPPVLLLVTGAILLRRSRNSWTTLDDLRDGVRPPAWLVAFPVAAFLLFVLAASLEDALVGRAIVNATTYEPIDRLPSSGDVRLVPREVAEQNAASAFNSPTETLTDFRIVRTADGLRWTALRTPQGAFRTFTKKSQGLVELDAEQTARSLRQVDAEFKVAPGLQVTDNLRWRLLKRRFLIRLEDPVGVETPDGPRIVVPYLEYKGIVVRRPVLGGVFVVSPDGGIEDLEPAEAARRPELAATGRIFPDTQARRIQDAYRYRRGLWNAWFVHEDQTQITDTEANRQPYLIDFPGDLGPQWVTVAEPYGRASAASAIFLTDAVTGRTRIWRVPRATSLSGNRRALQAVRAVSIPGIDFGDGGQGSGNFKVVEPRPVFVGGRLVYLTSVIPTSANAVSKTVVVDAETNKLVAVFDNDRDPEAEAKTRRYVATGEVPGGAGAEEQLSPDQQAAATPTPTATPSAGGSGGGGGGGGSGASPDDVQRRLDDVIRRQEELLREVQDLRDALARERGRP
jgi:hypothetical protein